MPEQNNSGAWIFENGSKVMFEQVDVANAFSGSPLNESELLLSTEPDPRWLYNVIFGSSGDRPIENTRFDQDELSHVERMRQAHEPDVSSALSANKRILRQEHADYLQQLAHQNYSQEDCIPTHQRWDPPAFNEPTLRNIHGRWVSGRYERGYRILPKTISDRPTPCQGCTNYYGKTDGGNKLVCAIHPPGVEGDSCPDWEGDR